MILDQFYTASDIISTDESLAAKLDLNPKHPIFEGHFPGLPVVPGVCMVQMQKEMMERKLSKKLQLKKANNIKFLSVINPLQNAVVFLEIKIRKKDESSVALSSRLFFGETVFFKIDADYTIVQ